MNYLAVISQHEAEERNLERKGWMEGYPRHSSRANLFCHLKGQISTRHKVSLDQPNAAGPTG